MIGLTVSLTHKIPTLTLGAQYLEIETPGSCNNGRWWMLENGEPFGTMSFSITVPTQRNGAFHSGGPEHKSSVTVKGTQDS